MPARPKKNPPAGRKSQRRKPSPLEGLDLEQRADLLAWLLAQHPELVAEAAERAESMLSSLTVEDVAEEVSSAIELCDVEEVYASAGRTEFGYEPPEEVAAELLGDAVRPAMDLLKERLRLGRVAEAAILCQGIVLGLYEHRDGCDTTDQVLGFDPDFPLRAAEEAMTCYLRGDEGKRRAERPKPLPLPHSFWVSIPAWAVQFACLR
ncbi:MAG: hypothetical protein AB7N76_12685 [Planctomycetota bacterium]